MRYLLSLGCAVAFAASINAKINLGTAAKFGLIGSSTITSTGDTVINGNVGLTPGSSITGFKPSGPGVINGAIDIDNPAAVTAHEDAQAAYNAAIALRTPPRTDLTGKDLGGLTLIPGTYFFSSSAQLTGKLTLDGRGSANGMWTFQIGSTLTTATAASVVTINSARPCNAIWAVGSSATLGTSTNFAGTVIAVASITVNSGVTVKGGLFALNGAVTLIDDKVDAPGSCPAILSRRFTPSAEDMT
jgi:hypothetical protein